MRSAADGALAGLAVTGRAGSAVNVRRCDMVRVPGGWCGASVEAWNGRRGHDVMTGPVCEECEQAQQRCRRQTSAPDDKSRPVSLASGRRARGCPRTCGTRCRSSATARSSNRAAIGRQCAKEGPGLVFPPLRLDSTFDFSTAQKFDHLRVGGKVLRPRVTHDYIRLKIAAPPAF